MTKTSAVANTAESDNVLMKGMTEKEFETLLNSQKKKFDDIDNIQKGANKQTVPLYWECGEELKKELFKSTEPKAKEIKRFAQLIGASETRVRRALMLATVYKKEDLDQLVEQGLHMGHLEHLLKLENSDIRKEIEQTILDNKPSTREVKQLVADVAATNKDAIRPASRKRAEECKARKRKDATNPVKAIPFFQNKLQEFLDAGSNLIESLSNVESMDSGSRKSIALDLEELIELLAGNRELIKTLEDEAQKRKKSLNI